MHPDLATMTSYFNVCIITMHHQLVFQVAEALIKKVLAPPSQKTKLIDATEVRFSISSL